MPRSTKQRASVEPGTLIAGKYKIEEQIGQGGMGLIMSAHHIDLQERVALKFLLAPEERAEEFQARFLREARVTAKLRGAHVARTLDFGVTDEGNPFIVMEYLEGINLRQLLRESGPLPLEVCVNYTLQTCEGLAEAHRLEVVHRDLKPANLFLTRHLDGADLVKILDFGVSKLRNLASVQSDLTEAGTILGSPKYMAVEQLMQAGDVDARADVWSLGAILYEMLSGRPPFEGANTSAMCMAIMRGADPTPMHSLRPELPAALDDVVRACLARDLSRRIPDVAALAKAIVDACGIPGLEPAAQAVSDVLSQQFLTTSTGQTRSFLQATGSNPAVSGRFRAIGGSDGSTSRSREVVVGSDLLEEPQPSAAGTTSARKLLIAAGALLVVGGAAAYLFTRPGTEPAPVSVDVPTIESATPAETQASPLPAATPPSTGSSPPVATAEPDAGKEPKPRATWRPRAAPPPPPPSKTAAQPTATATATSTNNSAAQDVFGSRY